MSNSIANPWFAVSMGLVGLIIGYGIHSASLSGPIAANNNQPSVPSPTDAPDVPAVPSDPADIDDDTVMGKDSATVTIIEFTDYQCPFCARHFSETYGKIKADYVDTGKVRYVVRDYPLGFHPHAQKAAEASECADEQGKFAEMHDKLFAGSATWSSLPDALPTFKQYASDLKLNASTFNDCLDSGKFKDEVLGDLADGSAAGISGTPGFWILSDDGQSKQISGAYPYETFKAAFDEML